MTSRSTGRDATAGAPEPASGAPDPLAVRARLGSTSRLGDEAAVRVGRAPTPLRMANPTTGVGPLGGASLPAADPDVRAQRQLLVDDVPADVTLRVTTHGRATLAVDGKATAVVLEAVHPAPGGIRRREVLVGGFRFDVEVESERIAALRERATQGRAATAGGGPLDVRAIIPGKVVSVSVAVGDAVTAGQQLLVVEAMKMQNELRAPRDGTIERVRVAPGVHIELGDLLVVLS